MITVSVSFNPCLFGILLISLFKKTYFKITIGVRDKEYCPIRTFNQLVAFYGVMFHTIWLYAIEKKILIVAQNFEFRKLKAHLKPKWKKWIYFNFCPQHLNCFCCLATEDLKITSLPWTFCFFLWLWACLHFLFHSTERTEVFNPKQRNRSLL